MKPVLIPTSMRYAFTHSKSLKQPTDTSNKVLNQLKHTYKGMVKL